MDALLAQFGGELEGLTIYDNHVNLQYSKGVLVRELGPTKVMCCSHTILYASPIDPLVHRVIELMATSNITRVEVRDRLRSGDLHLELVTALAARTNLISVMLPAPLTNPQNVYAICERMVDLVERNKKLRGLHLSGDRFIISLPSRKRFIEMLVEHTGLRDLRIDDTNLMTVDEVRQVIAENRSIRQITLHIDYINRRDIIKEFANNWVLRFIASIKRSISGDKERCWSSHWVGRITNYVVAMLPRRLPAYVMLWILDWIFPMNRRYKWRGDPAYDPFHGRKIALIEGLVQSYRRGQRPPITPVC
jgi:hypothetical protein